MWAGHAFSIDYRESRGHAYTLHDQDHTERVAQRPQPGACLHCHASIMPAYRYVGERRRDGRASSASTRCRGTRRASWPTPRATPLVKHPLSCVDCHDPDNMALRVTRPAFIEGIRVYQASLGRENYDVNRDATRQEMRTFVCAQCHVEYYFDPRAEDGRVPVGEGHPRRADHRLLRRSASPTGRTASPAAAC
jgi:nitrite reductase (cytochrome c-552)